MATETALAKPASFALVANPGRLEEELAVIEENTGGVEGAVVPRYVTGMDGRWKLAATGDPADPIDAIVLAVTRYRRKYDEAFKAGTVSLPVCYAVGRATHGTGEPGIECRRCPFDQFGSAPNGEGKACGQYLLLLAVTKDGGMPVVLQIPPTGLKAWQTYGAALAPLRTFQVVTRATNVKTAEGGRVAFERGEVLGEAELEAVAVVRDQVMPAWESYLARLSAGADLEEMEKDVTPQGGEDQSIG